MSYDLYFKPRQGDFSDERFSRYFRDRANYECDGSQAVYGNSDTGVYFVFELNTDDDVVDEGGGEHFPIAFHINYFRPSYFALEAEPEVRAFVQHFDLLVSDPQPEGMGEGVYVAEKFLSGWNCGNAFGYRAILNDETFKHGTSQLPTVTLHKAWRWNRARSGLQAEVGEAKFVPRILFINLGDETVTAAVWPDGIPVVVAPVDYLLVPRKELAPKKFFRKIEDTTLLAWKAALRMLLKHGSQNDDGSISLNYTVPPPDVVRFVQSLPSESRTYSGVAADKVLDREICECSIGL